MDDSIFEIQWSWKGPEHLQQANYVFQSQPKGLRFLRAVSAKESPKEMGLKGIHNPEALLHFSGFMYCPWCGKSGQNEGTIVNHLRTTHYKLGLICDQCFGCPTMMVDTLHQHGHITVPIRVLPPGRVLNLTPPGIWQGDLVSQLAFILKTATNLNGRKALTAIPSTAILEVISFQQTLHAPVYAGRLNWCPSERKRTMNSNIQQTNDNSLLTITVYTTK